MARRTTHKPTKNIVNNSYGLNVDKMIRRFFLIRNYCKHIFDNNKHLNQTYKSAATVCSKETMYIVFSAMLRIIDFRCSEVATKKNLVYFNVEFDWCRPYANSIILFFFILCLHCIKIQKTAFNWKTLLI